jgi:hypothetical protein
VDQRRVDDLPQSNRVRRRCASYFLLPRHITDLESVIERLHLKFKLCGTKVCVQALNMASLSGRTQGNALGHQLQACPRYSCIRVLFKQPLSDVAMQTMITQTHASVGYVGSAISEYAPSRRMTLLFDVDSTNDVEMAHPYDAFAPALVVTGAAPVYILRHQNRTEDTSTNERTE